MSTAIPALAFSQVSKVYGANKALSDIQVQVHSGEIVAILGANGAGKTTFINIASGLLRPTSGEARICGFDAMAGEVKSLRSALPQELAFPPFLKVKDVLDTIYSHHAGADYRTIARSLEIDGLLERYSSDLSGGERRKLALACALAGSPSLVLLDEPTANIDLQGQAIVRGLLRDYFRGASRALIFSSHHLQDVEALADRVIVIKKGRIIADSTVSEIKSRLGIKKVRYLPSKSGAGPSSEPVEVFGPDSDALLKEILRNDPEAKKIEIAEPSLEESIFKIWEHGVDA